MNIDDLGGYMIVDPDRGSPVAGFHWDLDLDDVERWFAGDEEEEPR